MAVVGLGTDIVDISRLEKALEKQPTQLAKRILTVLEFESFENARFPARFLAKRFAAKEAAVKALGTGIAQGGSFQDIEISHDALGKPLLTLSGKALDVAESMGVKQVLLSLSDEKKYAVATVLMDTEKL